MEEHTYRIVFADGQEVILKATDEGEARAAALEIKHGVPIIYVEEL